MTPWIFHGLAILAAVGFGVGMVARARQWLSGRQPGEAAALRTRFVRSARHLSRPAALAALMIDGLLFRRLWRASRQRWAIHAAIAWSFLGLFFVGSLGDMFADLGVPLGKDDPWFAFLNDLFGIGLLAGLGAAIVRRTRFADAATSTRFDDGAILGILAFLAAGGFILEGFRLLEEGVPGESGYAFAGYALARAFEPAGLDWATAHDAVWWVHGLVALGLVAWLPWSKLLHVVATPLSIALGAEDPAAPEADQLAPFVVSAGDKRVFSSLQMLELDACTRCGECLRSCSSFRITGNEGASIMGMIRGQKALFEANGTSGPEAWAAFQQGVFSCTLCGRCEPACPAGIRTRDLAISMRQEIASARCMLPKNMDVVLQAVEDEGNIFNFPNDDRALWAEFMDDLPPDLLGKEKAEVLYFVGCVGSFSPAVQEIPQAFLRVLLKAGVDVALLAGKEWCCGFPLIVGGRAADAQRLIEHNVAEVRRLGAKTIVFSCPSCYNAWAKYYRLPGIQLLHSTQFISELVAQGRLSLEAEGLRLSYHDPCDLGRGTGEYEAPRRVLQALEGADYVELRESRERSLCCGGGGDVEMWDPQLVGKINRVLVDAVDATGAQVLVDACQQCKRSTQKGLAEAGSRVRVMDIAEVALEFGTFAETRPER
jgi:heterodisulfide reductase subunit D